MVSEIKPQQIDVIDMFMNVLSFFQAIQSDHPFQRKNVSGQEQKLVDLQTGAIEVSLRYEKYDN